MAPSKNGSSDKKKSTLNIATPATYSQMSTTPAPIPQNAWSKPLTIQPYPIPAVKPSKAPLATTIPIAKPSHQAKKRESTFPKAVESMYSASSHGSDDASSSVSSTSLHDVPNYVKHSHRTIAIAEKEWLKPRNQNAKKEGIYLFECDSCHFFFPGCIVPPSARAKTRKLCSHCHLDENRPRSDNYKEVKTQDDECRLQYHLNCGIHGSVCRSTKKGFSVEEYQKMVEQIKKGKKPVWVEVNGEEEQRCWGPDDDSNFDYDD